MHDPDYQRLLELSWRRKLTAGEAAELQAWLAAHPAAREEWEAEAGLDQLLEQLPALPAVSSNFTARVLQEAALADAAAQRGRTKGWRSWWPARGWLPRVALASVLVAVSLTSVRAYKVHARRAMARSVAQFYPLVTAHPDLLENFQAIHRLSDQPKPDTELLSLME